MTEADTIKAETVRLKGLPLDPDDMNEVSADAAQVAVSAYMSFKSTDGESCIYDLLVDLRHWCDRNGRDFDDTYKRSQKPYDEETSPWPGE